MPTPFSSLKDLTSSAKAPGLPPTTTAPTGGAGTADNATTSQLWLGNNQWIDLQVRVKDLIRIGTDGNRTLADIKAVEVLVSSNAAELGRVATEAIQVDIGNIYLTGGYGPDVGEVGTPYVYRYRYRSSLTGEFSGSSPASRGGAMARRQAITASATPSSDPHGDLIDWFRQGGVLTDYTYVGTTAAPSFLDAVTDSAILDGEVLEEDIFQPWPVLDVCRQGTCTVAGAALEYTSGDTFNTAWARGTQVLVNGFTATIDQVVSSTVLLLFENVGSGTAVPFVIPEPVIMGEPLPALWSCDTPGTLFACGDPRNPGTVYWTKRDNPDVTSDINNVLVTAASDPLQNGWCWDGRIFVGSTKDIYELREVSPGVYEPVLTPAGKGLWAYPCIAQAPEGTYFLSDDGIYLTRGGDVAHSITDEDLYDLFPHDGLPGRSQGDIEAPQMSERLRLRLAWIDGMLYFDYSSIDGHERTLIFDTQGDGGGWIQDAYTGDGVTCRIAEPGYLQHGQVVARGVHLAVYDGHQDFGQPIAWQWQTADVDGGDLRSVKQWGDATLDMEPKGDTITIVPTFNHGDTTLASQTRTGSIRKPYIIDINDGAGQLARSMGLYVSGSTSTNPVLFGWEPAALPKVEDTTRRATDWDDLGIAGAKFIQGVLIRANTYGAQKTLLVQGDGTTQLTLNINQNGERTVAYPIVSTGWTPFIAHLVRLWPSGDDDLFQLYTAQWVFEPAPELASEWTTQPTTHDLPGYLHVRDAFIAYSDATAAITFEIFYDGVAYASTITPASTAYKRDYLLLPSAKGRAVSYRWKSTAPFRLYRQDLAVRVQGWGQPNGYGIYNPFGGPSRAVGAQI